MGTFQADWSNVCSKYYQLYFPMHVTPSSMCLCMSGHQRQPIAFLQLMSTIYISSLYLTFKFRYPNFSIFLNQATRGLPFPSSIYPSFIWQCSEHNMILLPAQSSCWKWKQSGCVACSAGWSRGLSVQRSVMRQTNKKGQLSCTSYTVLACIMMTFLTTLAFNRFSSPFSARHPLHLTNPNSRVFPFHPWRHPFTWTLRLG